MYAESLGCQRVFQQNRSSSTKLIAAAEKLLTPPAGVSDERRVNMIFWRRPAEPGREYPAVLRSVSTRRISDPVISAFTRPLGPQNPQNT
jgi:hypothetical protein